MAKILHRAQFTTWGFTDGGYLRRIFGLHQGFAHYEDTTIGLERLTTHIDRMLAHRPAGRLFLFVHSYDVHTPYHAPDQDRAAVGAQTWRGRKRIGAGGLDQLELERPPLQPETVGPLVSLYDAGVRHADRELGDSSPCSTATACWRTPSWSRSPTTARSSSSMAAPSTSSSS